MDLTPRLTIIMAAAMMLLPAVSTRGFELWQRSRWSIVAQAVILVLPFVFASIQVRHANQDQKKLDQIFSLTMAVYFILAAWGNI